jgi:hypothetical protein
VVGGGVVTVAIALVWRRVFPAMARIDRLQEIRPADEPLSAASPATVEEITG